MSRIVLVIEDNEQNLYLTTFILEKHGYQIVAARDGREGIDRALQVPPQLILLDIQLPVMDGYAVARELQRHPSLKSIPIIAITSFAMPGDREHVLAAGCTGYIEKPINPDTFISEIERYLSGSELGKRAL